MYLDRLLRDLKVQQTNVILFKIIIFVGLPTEDLAKYIFKNIGM